MSCSLGYVVVNHWGDRGEYGQLYFASCCLELFQVTLPPAECEASHCSTLFTALQHFIPRTAVCFLKLLITPKDLLFV